MNQPTIHSPGIAGIPLEVQDKLRVKITEIARDLEARKTECTNLGLLSGTSGLSLFYFLLYRETRDEKYADLATEFLMSSFQFVNDGLTDHRFCSGIGGFCWTLEFLVQNEYVDREDVEETLQGLDSFIYKAMMGDIKGGNFDYLHGALGNGLYFLKRLKPGSQPEQYLTDLIGELERCSVKEEDGSVKWESVIDHETGAKGFNLSLSHGLASIIVFLQKAYTAGIQPEKVRTLLEGSIRYMLKHRLEKGKFVSQFPNWNNGQEPGNSRLAWCYGDLGIGIALWHSARALKDISLEKQAVEILLESCSRRDLKKDFVADAGICHGTGGMAHIYQRLFGYTGNALFRETALFWLDETLKMSTYPDGIAGYKMWKTEQYGGWVADFGILEGGAGIGLSLLQALNGQEAGWDECLLLS